MTEAATTAPLDLDRVRALLAGWGVDAPLTLQPTDSEVDRTILVRRAGGDLVFKQSPAGSTAPAMQTALLAAAHAGAPHLPVPRLLMHRETGTPLSPDATAFVSTLCPGGPLELAQPSAVLVDAIAQAQADLLAALDSVDAAAASVPDSGDWSLDAIVRHEPLIDVHLPAAQRAGAHGIVDDYRRLDETTLAALPRQVIHADFNLSNLLAVDGQLTGIIDFGDAVRAPRIFDVAVTATYLALWVGGLGSPLLARYVTAITAFTNLQPEELDALDLLVRCRLVMVLVLGRETAARWPERAAYQLRYDALAERALSDALAPTPPTDDPQGKSHQ